MLVTKESSNRTHEDSVIFPCFLKSKNVLIISLPSYSHPRKGNSTKHLEGVIISSIQSLANLRLCNTEAYMYFLRKENVTFLFFKTGFHPWPSWNSLCRQGWPRTHRDLLASVSQVLGSKVCTITFGDIFLPFCVFRFYTTPRQCMRS